MKLILIVTFFIAQTLIADIEYIGIGVSLGKTKKKAVITEVVENSPAQEASVLVNDKLLKVDDTSTEGLSINKVSKLLRGDEGTQVRLTLQTEDLEQREVNLTRRLITIKCFINGYYNFDFIGTVHNGSLQGRIGDKNIRLWVSNKRVTGWIEDEYINLTIDDRLNRFEIYGWLRDQYVSFSSQSKWFTGNLECIK